MEYKEQTVGCGVNTCVAFTFQVPGTQFKELLPQLIAKDFPGKSKSLVGTLESASTGTCIRDWDLK